MTKLFLLAGYVLAMFAPTACAQTTLEGIVHDAAGKGLPGANITLQSAEGATTRHTTSPTGWFHFPVVEAGAYILKAEAPVFIPSNTILFNAHDNRFR